MATLRSYLESLLLERDVSADHAASLRHRLDDFGHWLGHIATFDDLTPDLVNNWVINLQTRYAPRTVKHYRDALLFVWRCAFDRGDCSLPPWRIRQIKIPQSVIHAWSLEELRQLVGSVTVLRGQVPDTDLRKRDWYRAYILTAYSTGLRRCDLMHWARWDQLSSDILTLCQRKTGYVVARRLNPQALEALRLVGTSDYLLPWPGNLRRFYESFKRVVQAAEIRPGGPKMLRRSAGSHVEKQCPGTGGHFLGHRDTAMFDRHYHDRSLSQQVPEPPPEI